MTENPETNPEMHLVSEGKPLVQTLVDFFEDVEQAQYEARVFALLDLIIRGSVEDADATGPDEQADHDQQDAEQHGAAHDGDDAADDQDDGDEPEE